MWRDADAPAGNGEPFREKVCSEDLVDKKRRESALGSPDSGYELVRRFLQQPGQPVELQYCYTIAAASSSTALALATCPSPKMDSEKT